MKKVLIRLLGYTVVCSFFSFAILAVLSGISTDNALLALGIGFGSGLSNLTA